MTLRELSAATWGIAARLRAAGAVPGDRLLIAAANDAGVIAAALGAARAGVVFTIVHPATRETKFRAIVAQVEPAAVMLDDTTSHLRPLVSGLPLLDGAELAPAEPFGTPVRTDPACLVYTSGSTGAPRGVMVSHDNVLFTTAAIQQRLQYAAGDTVGLFLPLSFDYGLYQVFLALEAQASLFIGEVGAPLRLAGTLAEQEISVFPAVPSLVTALVQFLRRAPVPLPRLRMVTNTGERLPPESVAALRALLPEVRVFPMYGLTECKRVSILLPEELALRPRSVGRPLDGTTVRVLAESGEPAQPGQQGDLVVAGPHVTMGYWRMPEETALRFGTAADGSAVLFTGDTGRMDAEGFVYFEGRSDAQIKRHGFRMSLLELESAALAVPGVAAAAAVAESDELCLFVTTLDDRATAAGVLRALRERVEAHVLPDRIEVVPSLPTTPHGKIDRRSLAATAAEVS